MAISENGGDQAARNGAVAGSTASDGPQPPSPPDSGGRATPTPGATTPDAAETETIDRDAMQQADYGGAREPAGIADFEASSEEHRAE